MLYAIPLAGMSGLTWKGVWDFIWHSNSIWSWIANIIIAFVLIKFIIYPVLGLALGTTHPIVAVVSESMDHRMLHPCIKYDFAGNYCLERDQKHWTLCGVVFSIKRHVSPELYWETCGTWYKQKLNITQKEFESFPLKNGFRRGDIIVLKGKKPDKIRVGDVIVFKANKEYPIIHRVVEKKKIGDTWYFTTKGDHNARSFDGTQIAEVNISEDRVLGVALFKIPWLGYIKIKFVDLLRVLMGGGMGV